VAVLRGISLGGVRLEPQPGLHNARLRLSASWHSVQGSRPRQEDRVTVIPDLSALGAQLPNNTPRGATAAAAAAAAAAAGGGGGGGGAASHGGGGSSYGDYAFFGIFDGHNGEACAGMLQHRLHLAIARQV